MRALTAALLIAATSLTACTRQPAPVTSPEPALWHIQDEDSDIWLLGTVHVLPGGVTWRGPKIEAAFAAANELVLETDVLSEPPSEVARLFDRYGSLPPGETLSGKLDAAAKAQLQRVAMQLHVEPAALETKRPWLAAQILASAYAAAQGETAATGVEATLHAAAQHRRTMRETYLESPEQQILTLHDLSPADEVNFLLATLRDIEAGDAVDKRMQAAWARGDVGALARDLDAQAKAAGPGVYDALISSRNQVWTDAIARRLDGSGRVFIAVGAAHLIGRDSVIAQLRARGIHVDGP